MANIKDTAKAYVPKTTKNIADLEKVSVEMDIVEKTFNEGTPEEFTVNVITIDDEDYRVPVSVIAQIKTLLEEMEDLEFFKVVKSGSGKTNTQYQVIPLR